MKDSGSTQLAGSTTKSVSQGQQSSQAGPASGNQAAIQYAAQQMAAQLNSYPGSMPGALALHSIWCIWTRLQGHIKCTRLNSFWLPLGRHTLHAGPERSRSCCLSPVWGTFLVNQQMAAAAPCITSALGVHLAHALSVNGSMRADSKKRRPGSRGGRRFLPCESSFKALNNGQFAGAASQPNWMLASSGLPAQQSSLYYSGSRQPDTPAGADLTLSLHPSLGRWHTSQPVQLVHCLSSSSAGQKVAPWPITCVSGRHTGHKEHCRSLHS